MSSEEFRSGRDYLETVTTLLQRIRRSHPTHGSYEAAEMQWWWGVQRSTDDLDQLFWFDDDGLPEAAVTVIDFGDGSSAVFEDPTLVVTVLPDATPSWVEHVVDRGLAHVISLGMNNVELEVDQADPVMRDLLARRRFAAKGHGIVECWLDAANAPEVSPLAEGYRLMRRSDTTGFPHHMVHSRRPNVEERLLETSLYRSDLDLVVYDADDNVAGYGLFWYDPVTSTGVVEPMRTNDDHQRKGLARHILTSGIQFLIEAGAKHISIGYEPDNPASGHLYRSAGFKPQRQTDLFSGDVSGMAP